MIATTLPRWLSLASFTCLVLSPTTVAWGQQADPWFSGRSMSPLRLAQAEEPGLDFETAAAVLQEEDAESSAGPNFDPIDETVPSADTLYDQEAPVGTPPPRPAGPIGAGAYKQVFYDNDFYYLDDPATPPRDLIERLKRLPVAPLTTLEFGGEYRPRTHTERNMRLNGRDDSFLLQRTRFYTHFRHSDWARVYIEFLDATSAWEDIAPRPFEENDFDMFNAFADVKLLTLGRDEALWGRIGRQEMLLGSQRLVSNRPWRNVPIFFEGARLMWRGSGNSIDAFWTRPLDRVLHQPQRRSFDNADQSQQFYGVFSSLETRPDTTVDFYWLRLDEEDPTVTGSDGMPGGFEYNTIGGRWFRRIGSWSAEIEGGYQFGDYANDRQSAGFYTGGLGYDWSDSPWQPSLWVFYDWASGDRNPDDDIHGTFWQLFPRGHYYMGWADVVGRQNIRDLNCRLIFKPLPKVTAILWYHVFRLDQPRDALYSAGNLPIRQDPTGAAGRQVGNELDVALTVNFSRQYEVLFGYSHLFAGEFLRRTGVGRDVRFFYVQQSLRF